MKNLDEDKLLYENLVKIWYEVIFSLPKDSLNKILWSYFTLRLAIILDILIIIKIMKG